MADLSLCIKKRTSNANIKDKVDAETPVQTARKIPVHTYIVKSVEVLTCKAIGGSKTNTYKDSIWHVFRRILLSLMQNHTTANSSILQHHSLCAKTHGTVSGNFALVCQ